LICRPPPEKKQTNSATSPTVALRRRASRKSNRSRRLWHEFLEERCLLSSAPLNVALISDAVAQAEQIRLAAAQETIAIVYHADTMTTDGLVDLAASISVARDGARIAHLGIVAHGGPGEVDLGRGENLSLATMRNRAPALERLRSVLTSDARLDLYACSVAAGTVGKTFVDELSAVTGAAVFASDDPVGTVRGANFVWEYHAGQAAASDSLFSVKKMETIPRLGLPTPATPTNPSPGSVSSPGPVLSSSTVTFSWDASTGATYYDLGVVDVATGSLVVATYTSSPTYTATLTAGKTYRWNVAAGNSSGESNFTSVRYFQTPTVAVPTVTVTSPNGGEDWALGVAHTITWTFTGDTPQLNNFLVSYSLDGGSTYLNDVGIASSTDRSISWTPPPCYRRRHTKQDSRRGA
jgi:hypothetical protein